jgi:hypothetical protein
MRNKYLIIILLVLFFRDEFYAQQNVLITDGTTPSPDASSLLELNSTNKGVLIPRVALTATTNQSPVPVGTTVATALLIYNTATINDVTPGFYYWENAKWNRFDTGNNIGDWKLLGNSGTNATNNFLGTTDNVDLVFRTNNIERIRTLGSNGKVGIGTAAPAMRLDVTDASTNPDDATIRGTATSTSATNRTYGVYGSTLSTATNASGIKGEANGAGSVNGVWGSSSSASGTGVYGLGTATTSTGVYGWASSVTGSNTGVWGESASTSGFGVFGYNYAASGTTFGVTGIADSPDGIGTIGENQATAGTGFGTGIIGSTAQSGGNGVYAENSNANGDALYAINSAASGTGEGSAIIGVTYQGNGATPAAGVWGVNLKNSGSRGTGVAGFVGEGTAITIPNAGVSGWAQSTVAGGLGVIGTCDNGTGVGVQGQTSGATGLGVFGFSSGLNSIAVYGQLDAGATGTESYAIQGVRIPSSTGTGYGRAVYRSAVEGYTDYGNVYCFGVGGYRFNDANRSGGVIGGSSTGNTPTAWGSLGYRNSGGTHFGMYGSAQNATWGNNFGGGYMATDNILTGIGLGGYGGIMGGWTRGEVMGHVSAGELFASYNLGNEYTSGYTAEIVKVDDKRVAAYTMTSTDIKVYHDGVATLTNGKARVNFDSNFAELIGTNKPVVTLTPMGMCNGIYISNVDSKGFEIAELNYGNSNVEFSYIVIGKRIDADNKPELPEALSKVDFDDKMKGVMFNENNLEQSATPIWWDGKKVRFDAPPQTALEQKKGANIFQMRQQSKSSESPTKNIIKNEYLMEKINSAERTRKHRVIDDNDKN